MREMNELTRAVDALEVIAAELERLRVLKEHELGVRLEESEEGHGPYVPKEHAEEEYEAVLWPGS
jgi:hypothetical protein